MEIAEVVDTDTLEDYFGEFPEAERRNAKIRVAFQSAARVLPFAAKVFLTSERALERDLTPVVFFGALAITEILRTRSTPKLKSALRVASNEARATLNEFRSAVANSTGATNAIAVEEHLKGSAAAYAIQSAAEGSLSGVRYHIAQAVSDAAFAVGWGGWDLARSDLAGSPLLWPNGSPRDLSDAWSEAKAAMAKHPANWTFWIHWYNRVLQNRDWQPQSMAPILERITYEDWNKGPTHINPMFDEVLALYLQEDATTSDASGQDRSTNHLRTIRAQVFTLQEFLQAEYLSLAGHNARSPELDDILELLQKLKALVDDMIARLDGSSDAETMVVVRETLPAVVEQAGELAVIEPEPVVSSTVATMSATIRSLTEAGADPELATKFAISEAAGKKLWPRIKCLFGRK